MQETSTILEKEEKRDFSPFSKIYWKEAAKLFKNTKMLAFAALICAIRIVIKAIRIPVIPGGLSFSFDAYVNALGAIVYGPLIGLLVGAISDTLGAIFFPSGPYFFPFIFVEMSSSFIFALFLWRQRLSAPRVITSKFFVSFVCNIILTSLFMKWMYAYFGTGKTYYFINTARIAKNLVMFPIEGLFIVFVLNAFLPVLKNLKFLPSRQEGIRLTKKNVLFILLLTLLSVALVLLYIFVLKDFLSAHNIKWL